MRREKLTKEESAFTMLIMSIIMLGIEVYYLYQYVTTGEVKLAPQTILFGDVAFGFVALLGVIVIVMTPLSFMKMMKLNNES